MTVGLAMYTKDQTVFREQLGSYHDCGFGYVRQRSNCVQRTTSKLPTVCVTVPTVYIRQGSNCVQRTTGKLPTVCVTVGLAMYAKDQTVFREQLVSYQQSV